MTKRNGNGGALRLYRAYTFRTKDPVIDEIRTLAEDHFGKRVNHVSLKAIEEAGGPTVSCMRGWFFGVTKRPQNPTIEAAGRAIGFRRKWVKMDR